MVEHGMNYIKFPTFGPESFWMAVIKALNRPETPTALRRAYFNFLIAPNPTVQPDTIIQQYGYNPVPERYRGHMTANANYFSIAGYHQKMLQVMQPFTGFDYLYTQLMSSEPIAHTLLDGVGIFLGVNIAIYHQPSGTDKLELLTTIPGQSTSSIWLVLESNGTDSTLAQWLPPSPPVFIF
jgi:hypothetical protein